MTITLTPEMLALDELSKICVETVTPDPLIPNY